MTHLGGAPPNDDAVADFYDSDHPWIGGPMPQNWDDAARAAGLATDVAFYAGAAAAVGGRVLEVGAGTGRVTAGLLRAGLSVCAVEPSPAMRGALTRRFARIMGDGQLRLAAQIADVAEAPFDVGVLAFGVLACLPNDVAQRRLLDELRARIRCGGALLLDFPHSAPLRRTAGEDLVPSWVRTHVERGTRYVRMVRRGVLEQGGSLSVWGHYDESDRAPAPFQLALQVPEQVECETWLAHADYSDVVVRRGVERSGSHGERIFVAATAGRSERSNLGLFWDAEPDDGLALTALAAAASRARDSAGAGLLGDPHAISLEGRRGRSALSELGGSAMHASLTARAIWFDEQLQRLAPPAKSMLSLGAGLCSRPWRLPACRTLCVTEIDRGTVLRYKAQRLADFPAPHVRHVAGDVTDLDLIREEMRRLARPCVISAEGVLPYLADRSAAELLITLAEQMTRGDTLLFDVLDPGTPIPATTQSFFARAGGTLRALHTQPEEIFADDASLLLQHTLLGAPGARVGLPSAVAGGSRLYCCEKL